MRKISQDYLLATEMQLIFNNVQGFEPVKGDLRRWKGPVGTIMGTNITVYAEVKIPSEFPRVPPRVEITPKVNHPNVDDNDFLSMRILAQWKPRYHVYQVIIDIQNLFARVPARPLKTKGRERSRTEKTPVRVSKTRSQSQSHVKTVSPIDEQDRQEVEKRTIEEEIIAYQSQIENINKKIEEKRISLLKNAGSRSYSTKELTISVEDDLNASLQAANDLLEILNEKFDDGDISSIDYLKLYRKYSEESYKASKKKYHLESSGESIMNDDLEKKLDFEADLYAAIVTLDNLARGYENGELEQVAYKKQLRSLIRNIFKTRMQLEKLGGFSLEEFAERENLLNRFDKGMRLMKMAQGEEAKDAELIPFQTLRRIPAKTAEFVSAAIELIDLTRLKSVARTDLLLADIDELLHVLASLPTIEKSHWMFEDMKNWQSILSEYKPSEIISEEECEKLEFQASKWLNEFRRMLKDL